jgi:hypothetical protein
MSQSDKQDKQVILMSVPRAPVAPRRFDFRQVSLYIVFRCIAASAMQLFYNYFISKYRSMVDHNLSTSWVFLDSNLILFNFLI